MKLYEQIRKAKEREQLSVRALSKRFGVHRRDVRQALASAVPPERKRAERPAPSLDQWKPTIDSWLAADRVAPRKQRHTARRVWQRLTKEHGALVGESTVRRYVAEVRRRMDVPLIEVMVPQHHPLGEEAEVDFGTASVYLAGVLVEVSMFIMRLSASGRGYARAYLNECQEVFLDGHVRAFAHYGGVPKRIRYENVPRNIFVGHRFVLAGLAPNKGPYAQLRRSPRARTLGPLRSRRLAGAWCFVSAGTAQASRGRSTPANLSRRSE